MERKSSEELPDEQPVDTAQVDAKVAIHSPAREEQETTVDMSALQTAGAAAGGGAASETKTDADGASLPPQLTTTFHSTDGDVKTWQLDPSTFLNAKRENIPESSPTHKFYKRQNSIIDRLVRTSGLGADSDTVTSEQERKVQNRVQLAVKLSFAVNVLLVFAKLLAAVLSGSLAVVASLVDSFLDVLSGSIIYMAARSAARVNRYLFPVGKTRLEPIAIIVFASIMGLAALQLIAEGAQALVAGFTDEPPELELDFLVWVILGFVIVSKLGLYLFCKASADVSASIAALVEDHRLDVITNSFSIVAVGLAGEIESLWFLDAGFAILFAVYVMFVWADVGKEQLAMLTGKVAEPELITQMTYIAYNHHEDVLKVDTVRAYGFGTRYLVEVDIVLPEDMPLRRTHDIGESLQHKLEALDFVERAFVHLDWEWDHKPGDEHAEP